MTNVQRILAGILIAGSQGGGALLLTLLIFVCAIAAVIMIAIKLVLPFLAAFALIKGLELVPALTKKGIHKQC